MTQEERDKVVELLVDKWIGKTSNTKEGWREYCEQFTDEDLLIALLNPYNRTNVIKEWRKL